MKIYPTPTYTSYLRGGNNRNSFDMEGKPHHNTANTNQSNISLFWHYAKRVSLATALFFFWQSGIAVAQTLQGTVVFEKEKGMEAPLPFVSVIWEGTTKGTQTNEQGRFQMELLSQKRRLVFSCVGYKQDTITINDIQKPLHVVLKSVLTNLETVEIQARRASMEISTLSTQHQINISTEGIQRLACCSLADAFENNATVDVGLADAVTGAKQIRMLGLAGVYSQINVDFFPSVRLLSQPYGLSFVSGGWIHGISISKGASTVSMGHESITGQVNVETKKPTDNDKFYFDYFINNNLLNEINTRFRYDLTKHISGIVLFNGSMIQRESDHNNDGFLDMPLTKKAALLNRYVYNLNDLLQSKFGFEVLYEDRTGGQTSNNEKNNENCYKMYSIAKRFQAFQSTGFSLNKKHNSSIAFNTRIVYHRQDGRFGLRNYDAEQKSLQAKLFAISNIVNDHHQINTGIEWKTDNLQEFFQDFNETGKDIQTNEHVGGVYGEYTYKQKAFTGVFGLRGDQSNLHGRFFTPRFHLKYDLWHDFTLRASAGKGWRVPHPFIENTKYLSSARRFITDDRLHAEVAWNYGISLTKNITTEEDLMHRMSLDFYRTDFENQLVVDPQKNYQEVHFYNLHGQSFANSIQLELYSELFEGFDFTIAYRFNDSRQTLHGILQEVPLISKHKAWVSLHYATRFDRWKFSLTTQFHGTAPMAGYADNPAATDNFKQKTPNYFLIHAQITRQFTHWEIFIGCENIGNYVQHHAIIDPANPFGGNFDASAIYAPIAGRHFNFGIRYKLD